MLGSVRGALSNERRYRDLLRLRNAIAGLPGGRQPRLRSCSRVPAQAAQGARARRKAVLRRSGLRSVRRAAPSTRAPWATAVCLAMKPVGKPDAGNPPVRFDERGRETGCCHMAQATAPVLDSTGGWRAWRKLLIRLKIS